MYQIVLLCGQKNIKILHKGDDEELGEILDLLSYEDQSSLNCKGHNVPFPPIELLMGWNNVKEKIPILNDIPKSVLWRQGMSTLVSTQVLLHSCPG